ncbi:Uncharacterised protein [Legionella beliardensis]|uniref:Uncharacterized protein n=1 Tax=Legionella beliardensis TaxID=91822 RepID=A0A378I804_9GAMM|nr:hypothetical protein [Legionella beliardensis]STX28524.1 Uncharacterised protein [Legionella beliardensis]
MDIKNTTLMITLGICCTANVVAKDFAYSRPEKCPAVSALQEKVVLEAKHLIETRKPENKCCDANGFPYHIKGLWDSHYFFDNYNTIDKWKFSFSSISADTETEALNEMKKELSSLKFAYGPSYYFGEWSCTYRTTGGDLGVWYVNENKDITRN